MVGGKSNGHRKPLMLFVHGFPELWYSWRHQMKVNPARALSQTAWLLSLAPLAWRVHYTRLLCMRSQAHTCCRHDSRASEVSWQAFMNEYEVAAFDMRGYGESEIPKVCFLNVRNDQHPARLHLYRLTIPCCLERGLVPSAVVFHPLPGSVQTISRLNGMHWTGHGSITVGHPRRPIQQRQVPLRLATMVYRRERSSAWRSSPMTSSGSSGTWATRNACWWVMVSGHRETCALTRCVCSACFL